MVSQNCSLKVFRPVLAGVVLSDDFTVEASSFEDYSADSLVRAGVPISDAVPFNDISLNSLDGVEEQASRIVESEHLITKTDNTDKK